MPKVPVTPDTVAKHSIAQLTTRFSDTISLRLRRQQQPSRRDQATWCRQRICRRVCDQKRQQQRSRAHEIRAGSGGSIRALTAPRACGRGRLR